MWSRHGDSGADYRTDVLDALEKSYCRTRGVNIALYRRDFFMETTQGCYVELEVRILILFYYLLRAFFSVFLIYLISIVSLFNNPGIPSSAVHHESASGLLLTQVCSGRVMEMKLSDNARKLESNGLWRRAAHQWLLVMSSEKNARKHEEIAKRRTYCLSKAASLKKRRLQDIPYGNASEYTLMLTEMNLHD